MRRRDDVRALVSDAVQRRRVALPELAAEVARRRLVARGAGWLLEVLDDVAAGTRSAGESVLRALLRGAGLPEPEWNAPVQTAVGLVRIDALWRSAGVAVEIDGARWHLDAASWEADLIRANHIQALGWRLLRFSVHQLLHEPEVVVAVIRAALADLIP